MRRVYSHLISHQMVREGQGLGLHEILRYASISLQDLIHQSSTRCSLNLSFKSKSLNTCGQLNLVSK